MSSRATARARVEPQTAPPAARPDPRRRPAPAPRTGTRRQAVSRRHLRRRWGLLVIPAIALALGGIVWLNVAKLAFTAETGRVVERARVAESDNVRLRSQLERSNATVVQRAQTRLNMDYPPGNTLTPLKVPQP